ncbi:hypothetical protein E4U21_004924 [Claviceps maximensis]|nr:hypothetical protein E4U21_004924 [Claviceps maximensis]
MKFANPLLILTAIYGAYSLVVPRDGTDIIDVLQGVQSAIDDLDSAVQGWTTDPTNTLSASKKLIETINNGTKTVNKSESLNFLDALILLWPVANLKTHAQILVDDLTAKKTQIESQGLCDAVLDQINQIDSGSKSLVHNTVSKIPEFEQGIGKGATQPILDAIDGAKDEYSEKNCVNKN